MTTKTMTLNASELDDGDILVLGDARLHPLGVVEHGNEVWFRTTEDPGLVIAVKQSSDLTVEREVPELKPYTLYSVHLRGDHTGFQWGEHTGFLWVLRGGKAQFTNAGRMAGQFIPTTVDNWATDDRYELRPVVVAE